MLRAENLSFHYPRQKTSVVQTLSHAFVPGSATAILGANGAGKSTLLQLLAGGLHASTGNVYYDDVPISALSSRALARKRAVLSQQLALLFPYTVMDVVQMGRHPFLEDMPRAQHLEIAQHALETVDMQDFSQRYFYSLSGGEQQRVQLARVMAQLQDVPNGVLFLDEPTSAMDLKHQHSTLRYMRQYVAQGGTAVCIVHDLNLAARYADSILLLHHGELVAQGTPAQVLTEENLQLVFGIQAIIQPHPTLPHTLTVAMG